DPFAEPALLIGPTTTAAELAGRMGVLVGDALRQLRVLGVASPGPDTPLAAETAAQLARWRGHAVEQALPAVPDLLGIEENPLRREGDRDQDARLWYTGERFTVLRRGFGRVRLRAAVIGVGSKTVGPMLVNRDEGHGVAFAGTVPDGETLVFAEDGHVRLEGRDVTSQAWAWKGACFAGSDDSPVRPRDFVFAGAGADPARVATFAVATPAGAFSPVAVFPHQGLPLPMPGVGLGETRFAFFVHEARFAGEDEAANRRTLPVPRHEAGFFGTTVFHGGGEPPPTVPSARIALSWEEHEAYAVRVLIPARFRALYPDEPEGAGALARVEEALERHRPAGVDVRVEYLEDRWVLGGGALGGATPDPLLGLRGGTELWPSPPTPPEPES
ncbi:MAG TPA: hypothetical protein VFQ45_09860, partial [Longimicrobium sp.]|nr:hypothetical protein [Longimicrobium sp.]